MEVKGYAQLKAKERLELYQYEMGNPELEEIVVQITHCGVCHSDVHLVKGDWGEQHLPLIPGHEVIGQIVSLGRNVKELKMGDRVGIGWQRGACGQCEACINGSENLCLDMKGTCTDGYGGFADYIKIDSKYAFKIPENLDSAYAAPLLCGGITVYNPMEVFNIKAGMHVGVIGVGGLGHLALQFAHALNCEVSAFSSTTTKEADAKKFGADHFITYIYDKSLTRSLDFIISTVHVNLDWKRYIKMLRIYGKLCFVGLPDSDLNIPADSLIEGQSSICGGSIGSGVAIMRMLEFASQHNIRPQIEIFPMPDANRAIQRVIENKVRYRAVLEN